MNHDSISNRRWSISDFPCTAAVWVFFQIFQPSPFKCSSMAYELMSKDLAPPQSEDNIENVASDSRELTPFDIQSACKCRLPVHLDSLGRNSTDESISVCERKPTMTFGSTYLEFSRSIGVVLCRPHDCYKRWLDSVGYVLCCRSRKVAKLEVVL